MTHKFIAFNLELNHINNHFILYILLFFYILLLNTKFGCWMLIADICLHMNEVPHYLPNYKSLSVSSREYLKYNLNYKTGKNKGKVRMNDGPFGWTQ